MRFLPWLMMMLATASAQTSVSKVLEQGVLKTVAGLPAVPEQDQSEILAATAALLVKHVTFRPDGTTSAFHTVSKRLPVEWKGLVVRHITKQNTTEADRLNGITKRYQVAFGCDAHRTWDSKTNRWSAWMPIANPTFPAGITMDWKDGKWTAAESRQLNFFTPGPGPSVTDPKPDGKSIGLPPGMTRGK